MRRILVLAMAMMLVGVLPSKATGLVPLALIMPDSHVTATPPAGFVSFCIRFVDQCASAGPTSLALTAEEWVALEEVNDEVNHAMTPEDDIQHYGRAEFWTIPTDGKGDCEDYALLKRKKLIDAGFPIRALRLAVVKTVHGEQHAVLTVVTDHGDYVLDNLVQNVRAWTATNYQWIERQDPDTAWGWTALSPHQEAPVTMTATSHAPELGVLEARAQ